MREIFIAMAIVMMLSAVAHAAETQTVKYIDAPKFEGQILLC